MKSDTLVCPRRTGAWTPAVLASLFVFSGACTNHNDKTSHVSRALQGVAHRKQARLLCFLPWGDNGDSIGRLVPKEGAPEGPMAFDISSEGGIAVLDQVNRRVLFLDSNGQPQRYIPLPRATFQDVRLLDDGAVALLDRLDHREILVLSSTGKVLGKTPLKGPFVPEGGAVTALLLQNDGLWVEVEHRYSVRVSDRRGQPVAERIQVPGRVLGDRTGRLWRDSPVRATLVTEGRNKSSPELAGITLTYPEPIRLTGLVRLTDGGFVVSAASISPHNEKPPMDRVYLDFIDAGGRTSLGRWTTVVPAMAEEVFQTLRATPHGKAALLHTEEQGVAIQEVAP